MRNEALQEIRLRTGYSQKDFANLVGIPYYTYKSYELGNKQPRPTNVKKMIKTFKKLGIQCNYELFYP